MKTVSVDRTKLEASLFMLRVGVFVVFAMWTIDKFLNPEHAASVFERYYMISWLDNSMAYIIGAIQAIIILAFVSGAARTTSYALVAVLHAVSTASAYNQYLDPWTKPNLLFYAAFPMLAACVALWCLRKYDNLWSVDACLLSNKDEPDFVSQPQAI